ncbi:DMT family transporter [Nonomuraea sp. FMUSA5-5]|uniref:DMT family transporter n=1 Tax=Nonomuraea composti TaxID=2720023 RepID=A0ABX1B0D8_9ACTN|nr:DMT family transporter [Nonomuraea sp. FMUSA5-5]NJP89982.1 DMT family transporter [Nonomuraea sp. FMUSA5-5]
MSAHRRIVLIAIVGALIISTSAPLVRLSGVSPATSALFRCAYAVPPMLVLAWLERRRFGPLPRRAVLMSWAAGVVFALDLLFWHHAIAYVGAGLATVLGNLQVFIVAFAAWALFGERPSTRLMVGTPVVFAGVVLISGVFDSAAYGSDPMLGVAAGIATSLSYAAYLLLLKGGSDRAAGPLAHATVVATVAIAALSPVFGGADLMPSWPAHGWLVLLALGPQVVGWSLITYSLPRQPAALTALLLLVQPMSTVAISTLVLGERPSVLQLAGCAVVVVGVLYGSRRPPARASAEKVPSDDGRVSPARSGQA